MNDLSLIADLVRAGLDPALIARVANALVDVAVCGKSADNLRTKVDETAARRRENDRERQRIIRRQSAESAENPQMSENALTSSSFPSEEKIQDQGKKERAKSNRGVALSADWNPSDVHFDEGVKLGLDHRAVSSMADDMRLWAGANSNRPVGRKSNWDMAFSGWMRRAAKDARGRGPPKGTNGFLDLSLKLQRQINDERDHEDHEARPLTGTGH